MSLKPFNLDDHVNGVADAIIKLGGVDKAAEILDEVWLEVEEWIRRGWVPARLVDKIHYKTGIPIYELLQGRGH